MDGVIYTFFQIVEDKSLFCFFYDIDPIFETLDSILSPVRLIEYYGFDDYVIENWINKDILWR